MIKQVNYNVKRKFNRLLSSFLLVLGSLYLFGCKKGEQNPNFNTPQNVYILDVIPSTNGLNSSIILQNNSGKEKNISGWSVGNSQAHISYILPTLSLKDQEQKAYLQSEYQFVIQASGETIFLNDASGNNIDIWQN